MTNKTIKKIKKGEKIFFLFKGQIFEEKLNARYYLTDYLYIETDSFNVRVNKKLINQSKSEIIESGFEKVVVSSNKEELISHE